MESQAPQTFEEIKARLDEIVAAVSDEELPLDEALSLYEEAVGIGLTASRIVEEGIAAKEAESRRGSSLVGFRVLRPRTNRRRCRMARILDSIDSPDKLKLLTDEELSILAQEIREEIINVTSKTGGHVASSLGAVEIILAVHSLIDSPHDRFLFDVGHQSYAHMLITGRLNEFPTLRQYKGLSGFPKPHSNPHDVHPSGHASDSLSVACGLARARDLRGDSQKIVALIGDASLAGGMAFEALNDIGQAQTPLVIILNDNEMSIARNVGAMAMHLGALRVTSNYRKNRDNMQDFMENSLGPAGKAMVKLGKTAKESLKQFVMPDTMLFEQLGIVCTPPVDGHDIPALKRTIGHALESDVPVLVHVVTKRVRAMGQLRPIRPDSTARDPMILLLVPH